MIGHMTSFGEIREHLLNKKLKNLQFESIIISGENHMTAILSTGIKGLKFLYGK